MYKVDNAVIMAAGTSSRFAPLSYETHKALIEVKGECLIERQIKQLREAGIDDIYIVTGYKAEQFEYLKSKYGVKLRHNDLYLSRNNNASIYAVRDILKNTYICSADNYFEQNPFEAEVDCAYYSAVYANGQTKEWCLSYRDDKIITDVKIGGENAWYMLGHAFWDENFSRNFTAILNSIYELPSTQQLLWESIYHEHIEKLPMKIRKYPDGVIFEFDTLDELREFDKSYIDNTRSNIIKRICEHFGCEQSDIKDVTAYKDGTNAAAGFSFSLKDKTYKYSYEAKEIRSE